MRNRVVEMLKSQRGMFLIITMGALVLALFFVLLIRPAKVSIEALDRQIAEAELREEKMKIIVPVYQGLAAQELIDIPEDLSIAEKSGLSKEEIAEIIPRFKPFAVQAGLTTVS
ncbi:MAG: hypothetical protein PHU03_03820, partial [Syntrophales bacterium]|nr:hypothetical protein [Syntrophales bacterium]